VQHRIEQLTARMFRRATTGFGGRHQRFEHRPLGIGQVGRIAMAGHGTPPPHHDRLHISSQFYTLFRHPLDPPPNAVYLMDIRGNVAFPHSARTMSGCSEGLQALVAGRPRPIGDREPLVIPMLKALGVMREVLDRAGPQATQDICQELPGVHPLLRLAALFHPLPPLARVIVALATLTACFMSSGAWLAWLASSSAACARRLNAAGYHTSHGICSICTN
jgi:hypothetical protein